jgi:hypothetical protein
VDELLASVARHNKTGTDFLKADLEAALTFADIARTAEDAEERERNRRAARRAYDTIVRLINKVELNSEDANVMRSKLARLKSDLSEMDETF